jgi:hypothetical protein
VTRRTSTVLTALAVSLAAACLLAPASALAGRKPAQAKASIKITGISVNEQNVPPGTTVTDSSPVNVCYGIGGADQDPYSVQVYFFLHAVSIPKTAPTMVLITTPWDSEGFPSKQDPSDAFSSIWYTDRGHSGAALYGGPDGKDDYFHYDDEGTVGNTFDGTYTIQVSVKVHGHVLHARGKLIVDC